MSILHIKAGKVIQRFMDVATVGDARKKYPHLKGQRLVPGNHATGTLYADGEFTIPPPTPKGPEAPVKQALRMLAAELGPEVTAKLDALIGPEVL
jgi:hypothetical protein